MFKFGFSSLHLCDPILVCRLYIAAEGISDNTENAKALRNFKDPSKNFRNRNKSNLTDVQDFADVLYSVAIKFKKDVDPKRE